MRTFYLLALATLPWSTTALAAPTPATTTSDTSVPSVYPEARPMLSQGDPSWRWVKLGRSTVGKIGCLSMSVYDAFVGMGLIPSSTDPGTFVRMLASYGLYTPDGSLRWNLDKLFPHIWVERIKSFGSSALHTAALALSSGKQVLIEVRTARGTNHWVRVSRVVNGDALVRDPNGGRIGWLNALYGVQSIRGMATIMAQ